MKRFPFFVIIIITKEVYEAAVKLFEKFFSGDKKSESDFDDEEGRQ